MAIYTSLKDKEAYMISRMVDEKLDEDLPTQKEEALKELKQKITEKLDGIS